MASLVPPTATFASSPEAPLTNPSHLFTIRPVKGSPPSSSRSARTRAKIPNVASPSSPLADMSLTSTAHHPARNGMYPVRAASAIRGPRTPPFQRFPLSNCKESTGPRSDPSPSANISKDSSDLHRSVLALRRMNSEVSDGSSVSHDHTATATATATSTSTIGAGGQPHQRGSSQYYWKLGQTSAEHMRSAMITPMGSPTALGSPRATLRSSSSPITTTAAVGRHTFRFQASRSPRRSSSRLNTVQSSGGERQETAQGREGEMKLRMEMEALQTTQSSQRFVARDSKNFEMPSPRSGGEIPVLKGGRGGWLQQAEEDMKDDEGRLEIRDQARGEIYDHDGFLKS